MSGWLHHWEVLKKAIRDDRAHRKGFIPLEESEFLPAALEVTERPVSPTARVVTWAALIFLALAIAWTIFGRVDVVASATGMLKPTGNV